jgi:hypothetical protein
MILPIKNNPTGGMSKDIDRLYVGQGDYLDALNITHITDTGGTTQSVQPSLGTEYAFGIEKPTVQNKYYSITIADITAIAYANTVLNSTFVSGGVGTSSHTITTPYGSWALFALEIDTWLNGLLPLQVNVYIDPSLTFISIEVLNNFEINIFTSKITQSGVAAFPIYCTGENIYPALIGRMKIIGSYDLNGDLFIWSCVDRNFKLPDISTVVYLGAGKSQITTAEPHGLQTGDNILIDINFSSSSSTRQVIVTYIDDYNFTVSTSIMTGTYVSGTLSFVDENLSEIGVAQKDFNKGIYQQKWTYIRLIRSKQLNFRVTHQVDTYCEINNCIPSLYWTDNFNKPKVMYYYGQQYLGNGFLTFANPEAIYDYDTIGIESNLVLGSPNIRMTVTQSDDGGQLKAYARQYVVRFSTNKFDYTEWSYVSNLIPMTKYSSTSDWIGWAAYPTTQTSKKNIITVENVNYSIYNYVQLGVIEYPGTVNSLAVTGYIAKTIELIGQNGDILTLDHTGFETQILDLDITTIPQVFAQFDKALNISALNNRLILSNLTTDTEYDLTAWAKTIQYDLNIKTLDAFGDYTAGVQSREYQLANNQSQYTGYMRNEKYRFGIQVHYKGGQWSSAFIIDDITFSDTITSAPQQQSALSTLDLTSGTSTLGYPEFINVAYPSFTNIDLNYILSDGKTLSQVIDGFRIVRLDCVPEVLFTGTAFMSTTTVWGLNSQIDFFGGGTYTPATPAVERLYANICSPDVIFGLTKFNFVSTDIIKTIGAGTIFDQYTAYAVPNNGYVYSVDGEFNNAAGFTDISLEELKITPGTPNSNVLNFSVVGGNNFYNGYFDTGINDSYTNFQVAVAIKTDVTTPLNNTGTNNDTGLYYVQYFRANPTKYDEILNPQYKSTGQTEFNLSAHTIASSYDVFGGDTFVQRTYFLNYIDNFPFSPEDKYALGFYSENRGNLQYRYGDTGLFNSDTYATFIPGVPAINILQSANAAATNIDQIFYTTANNPKQQITSYVQYDPAQIANCLGTRIYYSTVKVRNGNQDGYRVFLPLNFKDLNPSFGDIINTEIGNGELLTWQEQYFERQYFSNSGTLLVADGSNLLVGDGSILAREPQYITKFGTKFKWGVIKGVSKGGNDTFYWINDDYKKIVRFGYDGTVALSDIQGVKAFLENNLTYAQYFLSPAAGYGIHGVWHDYKGEAIWTLRSYKQEAVWEEGQGYSVGQYVIVEGDTNTIGYEQYPQVYVAIQGGINHYPPDTLGEYWEKVPLSNTEVYQNFTLAYNEIKNKFTTFYTYRPTIYLAWRNTFLSPCPIVSIDSSIEDYENVYEHNLLDISGWYCVKKAVGGTFLDAIYDSLNDTTFLEFSGTSFLTLFPNLEDGNSYSILDDNGVEFVILEVLNNTSLIVQGNCTDIKSESVSYKYCNAEEPYIEMVTNYEPNDYKVFLASQFNCETNPQKIEYRGQNYVTDTDSYTYTERYELEKREGYWYTPIYNDVTGSSNGNIRTEDTSRMFGKYLRTKFIFKLFRNNKLFNFITKLTLNSRSYKK